VFRRSGVPQSAVKLQFDILFMKLDPPPRSCGEETQTSPEKTKSPLPGSFEALLQRPLFRLNNILLPMDFSDCARKALQYAIPFARQFGAELTLVHVVRPYGGVPDMTPVPADVSFVQDAEASLALLRQEVGDAARCKTLLRMGIPHLEIIDAAQELGSDLIILSTHGRTGLGRLLLGSTTELVVRHARCPVLIVREQEHEFIVEGSLNPAVA
jgi:universal stress protein A